MARLPAALTLAGALLLGCKSVPLAADPLSPQPSDTRPKPFGVDWWRPLVTQRKLLEVGQRELAAPAYDPERHQYIVLTSDGVVHALAEDGEPRWTYRAGGSFNAGATVHEGKVLVPGGNGTLSALDAASGALLWKYDTGEELGSRPVVAEGKVFVASQNDAIFAVESATGKWLWQYRRETPSGFTIRGVSTPVVNGGVLYLGFADGVLAALDLQDGAARWERQLSRIGGSFPDVDTTPVLVDGRLYVASYKDGLFALDPATGQVLWNTPVRGITDLLARGGVLFASGDGQVAAFRAEDGQQVWTLPLEREAGRQLAFVHGMLLVPVQDSLVFVDPSAGRVMTRWDPGQGVTAGALPAGGRVLVLSNLGYVYALVVRGDAG